LLEYLLKIERNSTFLSIAKKRLLMDWIKGYFGGFRANRAIYQHK
jgi:hypothetical protein